MSSSERPDDSVLDALGRRTGELARVQFSGADEAEEPLQSPLREAFLPRRRGDHQIQGEVARGGMGRVLKAPDSDLGRDVAVKVLGERLAGCADVLRRFVEEAQVGGQLQHPGVVPVYELVWLGEAQRTLDACTAEAPAEWTDSMARRQLELAREELGD
jgi:hypothetical protein